MQKINTYACSLLIYYNYFCISITKAPSKYATDTHKYILNYSKSHIPINLRSNSYILLT